MKLNKEQLLLFAVFTAGIIFGIILIPFFNIEVDSKVNLSDILSMLLTAVIGIYLSITIGGRQSSSRFEKEFLISEVKRITEYIDAANLFKNTVNIPAEDAAKGFKELNIRIFNFESILSDADYCQGLEATELRNAFKNLRVSILHLTSRKGLITPTSTERTDIVNKYSLFRKEVFKIITEINRYS